MQWDDDGKTLSIRQESVRSCCCSRWNTAVLWRPLHIACSLEKLMSVSAVSTAVSAASTADLMAAIYKILEDGLSRHVVNQNLQVWYRRGRNLLETEGGRMALREYTRRWVSLCRYRAST